MKKRIKMLEISIHPVPLFVSVVKLAKRHGVCSQKSDGTDNHMLLFDFDDAKLADLTNSLLRIHVKYKLPTIYIIQSSPTNYHAYCFSSRSFSETVKILEAVPETDRGYIRLGKARGYFTLRISARDDENFLLINTLKTSRPREMLSDDMTANEYLTTNKGGKHG